MSENARVPEIETFRIVMPRNSNSEVLLLRDGDRYALPQVTIPKWNRVARCITESVAKLWSLSALCLFQPEIQNKFPDTGRDKYFVMEPRDPHWCERADLAWVSRDKICSKLQPSLDADVLQEILETADCYNAGTLPGPFARYGWFDDLISWAQSRLNALRLTGKFRQFNGDPFFSLIRLETNGPSVWFKAVGEPNLHEYGITISLADRHSLYFPKVFAARPDWHGWLMEEAQGQSLEESKEPEAWFAAASTLGGMQSDFTGQTNWLLTIGCRDYRIPTVLRKLDPFLEVITELMQKQPSATPPALSRTELMVLGRILNNICYRLHDLGIPDSLGHCDLNPANIIVTKNGGAFIDWAEAYVGFPFATFEYLRLTSRNYFPRSESWNDKLEDSYFTIWESLTSRKRIAEARTLTPIFAALFAAMSTRGWEDPQNFHNPLLAKWLRSLTRRMQREVQILTNSGNLCIVS